MYVRAVDDVMAIKPRFLASMGYHIFLTMVSRACAKAPAELCCHLYLRSHKTGSASLKADVAWALLSIDWVTSILVSSLKLKSKKNACTVCAFSVLSLVNVHGLIDNLCLWPSCSINQTSLQF